MSEEEFEQMMSVLIPGYVAAELLHEATERLKKSMEEGE